LTLQSYDYLSLLHVRGSLISKLDICEFKEKPEKISQFYDSQEEKLNEIQHLIQEIYSFNRKLEQEDEKFSVNLQIYFEKLKKCELDLKNLHYENRKYLDSNLKV
jgi:hypothetical protein